MKIINNYINHSSFTPSPSNVSLKKRIKAILPWNKNDKMEQNFEKKFTEKLVNSIVTNKYEDIKKAGTLLKKFPENKKIFKIYRNLLKERTQLVNKTLKPIRTKEQAQKALELVNKRINNYTKNIDSLSNKPKLSDRDKKTIELANLAKTMMYNIRDQIEKNHFDSIHPKSSKKVTFNPETTIRRFSDNDPVKTLK